MAEANAARKRGLSAQERSELWRRWKQGQSLSEIGLALGKAPASIFGFVTTSGGIAPQVRHRSPAALTVLDREEISRGVCAGGSLREIASQIHRSPSTISREIARNGGREGYRAAAADLRAWKTGARPKVCKLATSPQLQCVVAEKLQIDWSPEQIAGWLKQTYVDDKAMQVSHETIYRSLFIQARGVLKRELLHHLRSGRLMRRAKGSTTKGQPRGQIIGAVSIRERPSEIEDRAVPGHWEGDLLSGSKNTHIATLVERQTRYTKLVKVEGKDTASVVSGLKREIRSLPRDLRRTLTWDRGTEMAAHKSFSVATKVKVYFCDPQSPWQRGTNENTNGLLRQYFPDGTDLSQFSQQDLNEIARRLNQRPRKTLGFRAPADALNELLS